MTGEDDLKRGIEYMTVYSAEAVWAVPPEVILGGVNKPGENLSNRKIVDRIGVYRELGVSTVAVSVKGRTAAEWCDNAEQVGVEVIARIGRRA